MKSVYYGGDILTMEAEDDRPEAVLVENGIIKKVGRLSEMENSSGSVRKVDLQGKVLMPSFIDTHSHISMTAQMAAVADLSTCNNYSDIVQTLISFKHKSEYATDSMIIGFGYDHNSLLEEKHPDKEILNQVSKDTPVFILHISGHMGCTNDAGLKLAHIDERTPNPPGGVIGRIPNTNVPNGYLEEAAIMLVQAEIMPHMQVDTGVLLDIAQKKYYENGITTVQDGAASLETVKLLSDAAEADRLKIDVVSYPLINANVDTVFKNYSQYVKTYRHHFKIGGYKLVLDGSPQGKSAWLSRPYENAGDYCAYPWFQDQEVEEFTLKAVSDNQQLLVHCNGDAASEQFLNAYEKAILNSSNEMKMDLRPVMIHCQTVRKDQLDRMASLKMIPSIFVGHTYYWGDVHLKNLGLERGNHISPVKSALSKGLIYNFHQDTPVTQPSMLHSVWCAVNRITKKGKCIGEDERIGVYDALKGVTIHSAYAYFEENKKGSIKEGKVADLVILDKNPLKVPTMDIKDIQVLETIKEGTTIYKA